MDLVSAEFVPLEPTKLTFWQKFAELQYKMLIADNVSSSDILSLTIIVSKLFNRNEMVAASTNSSVGICRKMSKITCSLQLHWNGLFYSGVSPTGSAVTPMRKSSFSEIRFCGGQDP